MKNQEFGSGDDRVTIARKLGYEMTVLKKHGLEDGIQNVRSKFADCSFDKKLCKRGIECLDFYRKKWNDSLKRYYDEPQHDQYSHGADAFRYAIAGINTFGGNQSKLSKETIEEMRRKHLGY